MITLWWLIGKYLSIINFNATKKERQNMATVKEKMKEIIEEQPDDSSYDEILRELAFVRMVERGVKDSQEGRTISNEEMKNRIKKWQK